MAMTLFARNLIKYGKDVIIEDRDVKIVNGLPTEVFSNPTPTLRAIMKTLRGVKVFDSTNTERVATHRLSMDFRSDVTAEKWVKFGTKRIKILTVEDCCEDERVMVLMCTSRGEDSKVINEA